MQVAAGGEFFKENLLGKLDFFVAGHDHILSDEGEYGGTHHFVSGGGGKSKYGFKRKLKGRFQKSAIGFGNELRFRSV